MKHKNVDHKQKLYLMKKLSMLKKLTPLHIGQKVIIGLVMMENITVLLVSDVLIKKLEKKSADLGGNK